MDMLFVVSDLIFRIHNICGQLYVLRESMQ
jgi:hypothetical protein